MAALQPIVPVVPNMQMEAAPASGYGFTINAAPMLTAALLTAGNAPQHAADQVFLNLSGSDGNQSGRTLQTSGGVQPGLASASEAVRQEMDVLLWEKSAMNVSQPDLLAPEAPVMTMDTLDAYFAQIAEIDSGDGE